MAKSKSKIVAAVGTASASSSKAGFGEAIQKAMGDAYVKCLETGVLDPDEQRAAMQEARSKAKAEFAA